MDISEAIDAADPSYLDTMEFQEADAIPLDAKLPKEHYLVHEVSLPINHLHEVSSYFLCFHRTIVKKYVHGYCRS